MGEDAHGRGFSAAAGPFAQDAPYSWSRIEWREHGLWREHLRSGQYIAT